MISPTRNGKLGYHFSRRLCEDGPLTTGDIRQQGPYFCLVLLYLSKIPRKSQDVLNHYDYFSADETKWIVEFSTRRSA